MFFFAVLGIFLYVGSEVCMTTFSEPTLTGLFATEFKDARADKVDKEGHPLVLKIYDVKTGKEVDVTDPAVLKKYEKMDNLAKTLGPTMFLLLLMIGRIAGGVVLTVLRPRTFFRISALLGLIGAAALYGRQPVAGHRRCGRRGTRLRQHLAAAVLHHGRREAHGRQRTVRLDVHGHRRRSHRSLGDGATARLAPRRLRLYHSRDLLSLPIAAFPEGRPGDGEKLTTTYSQETPTPRKTRTMQLNADSRIVMTLDAGGTNLRFSAIRGNQVLFDPIQFPTEANNLTRCLANIVEGFTQVRARCPAPPVAISFAFPGPVDYPAGIVGDLGNLPGFRGGVALGPMLEERFGLPTLHQQRRRPVRLRRGDLRLPAVRQRAAQGRRQRETVQEPVRSHARHGLRRRASCETANFSSATTPPPRKSGSSRSKLHNRSASWKRTSASAPCNGCTRNTRRSSTPNRPRPRTSSSSPPARARATGRRRSSAFSTLGEAIGDALANAMTLIDGLVVIGGGLSAAAPLFMPRLVAEMNGTIETLDGRQIPRMELKAFNLEDAASFDAFARGEARQITVPGSSRQLTYDPLKRIGVGLSRLGTSEAVAVGAYAFALHELDRRS